LLPTAGTIPTIPDDTAGAAAEVFVEELAVTVTVFMAPVEEAAPCGSSCDAAIVASGFPLGSTKVISPVGAASFLCPPLCGDLWTRDTGAESWNHLGDLGNIKHCFIEEGRGRTYIRNDSRIGIGIDCTRCEAASSVKISLRIL
jgi:hypothetical protein